MRVFAVTGTPDVATVYMADMGGGRLIEFVEALQPPYSRDERWILMVSTLFGCPVKCLICDAGGRYQGKPTVGHILAQVDFMVKKWYPEGRVPAQKFKIQFARMGEPSLNMAVLEALDILPERYDAPGLMPSISTIAPHGTESFFDRLIEVKNNRYANGRMQFQFSIHTTDIALRDLLIPVRKWNFEQMAAYGERFFRPGDRKITLNFALCRDTPVDVMVMLRYFDPSHYLIKITPVNPTCHAVRNGLVSYIDPYRPDERYTLPQILSEAGYEVIVSIGQVAENSIGSNCGQYVLKYLEGRQPVKDGYTYEVQAVQPDRGEE